MAKCTTPTFVVKRRIYVSESDAKFLDKKMSILNRMYNIGVKYTRDIVDKMKKDNDFILAYDAYKNSNELTKKKNAKNLSKIIESYGLTEYSLHKWFGIGRKKAYNGGISSTTVQKTASALYKAVQKAIFNNTQIHFKKFGDTNAFIEKQATTGIIYNPASDRVKVLGRILKLKPIREKDYYLKEALDGKRVKYCGIKREPFGISYRYFLLIFLEGEPPLKLNKGNDKAGIDQGTSTIAIYGNNGADFQVLAKGFEKYNKQIIKQQRCLDRKRKINNPQCYESDGTIKKGTRFSNYTNGMKKAKMRLKSAYRKKMDCVKQKHNYSVNRLIEKYDCIIKEPMNFKALAKRSKNISSKPSQGKEKIIPKLISIKRKDGTIIQIHKCPKKKRYGKSINNRSPGYFNSQLEKRLKQYGGKFININLKEYKASQYNHITQVATKPKLSDRGKIIGGFKVQRDLYSAFLLRHMKYENTIDFEECKKDFKFFLKAQQEVIDKVKLEGDITKNFGIKFFMDEENT